MDVVLEHTAIGGFELQQVLIPGLDGFQLVLSVFGLALYHTKREREGGREREMESKSKEREKKERKRENDE